MQRRGERRRLFILAIALLLALTAATANHTATLTLAPFTVYETTINSFNLSVNNFGSQDIITSVQATITDLEITSIQDFKGWTENFTTSSASWTGGSIAPNVLQALFPFTARAPAVTVNTTRTLTVTTQDDTNAQQTQTLQFTILNDETGPLFTNLHPTDDDFVAQGTTNYAIQVTAMDLETGVNHVDFTYQICNGSNQTQIALTKSNDTYARIADFSLYADSTFLCFAYGGESNGNAKTTYTGRLGVDGIAPSVALSSPANGAMINGNTLFQFNATDNLASTLRCELVIDGGVAANATVTNGATGSFPATNATEGIHTWNVVCADLAGLSGSGATRGYTLDRTPPQISSTPVNGSVMAGGTVITFSATDNFQLNQVTLTYNSTTTTQSAAFALDTTSWPDGPTPITITASDQAGNVGTYLLTYTVDRTPPIVSLVSPLTTSDVHANFTFTAFDTHDATLRCELYVDNAFRKAQNTTNLTTVINDLTTPGAHNWRVECLDDANNRGVSANQPVTIVDISGPDVIMQDVAYFTRGPPMVINVDITDISGVQDVTATLRDPNNGILSVTLTNSGSTYTLTYPTTNSTLLGVYTATFSAVDTLNYTSTSSEGYLLTYAYLLTLALSPSATQPGSGVSVTGTVINDNGSLVPETHVTLAVPGQNATSVPLNVSGNYAYAFNAPTTDGTYTVIASIVSAQNKVTYNKTEQLTVTSPAGSTSDGNGGNGNGGGVRGRGISAASNPSTSVAASSSTTTTSTASQGERDNDEAAESDEAASPSSSGTASSASDSDDDTAGVGKATGFFNLDRLNDPRLVWTFLIFLGILGVVAATMRGKKPKEEKLELQDKLGLEDYLNQRR